MLTCIEIDRQAIKHNIQELSALLCPETQLMPVIKSNAYGHGLIEIARICDQNEAVDALCVAGLDEALVLLKNRIRKPLLILSFFDFNEGKIAAALKKGVAFTVYTREQVQILARIGKNIRKKARLHLKIDSGTTRLGILPDQAVGFVNFIKKHPWLYLEGVYSHLSSSEENHSRTKEQGKVFGKITKSLEERFGKLVKHLSSSAGTILYPELHFDAVRPGLALYGLYPSTKCSKRIKLRPALSWHTRLLQIKTVPRGTKIGYGETFVAQHPMTIGTLPVGYSDGYDRRFSNNGSVIYKGRLCPVVGRVCMNLTMINISKIPSARVGDEVVLIGQDKRSSICAEDLADWAKTINYEIMDRLSSNLPRLIIDS